MDRVAMTFTQLSIFAMLAEQKALQWQHNACKSLSLQYHMQLKVWSKSGL